MIPTRNQIQEKLDKCKKKGMDFEQACGEIAKYLKSLKLPQTVTVASREVNPTEEILSDLNSYIY